MSTFIALLFWFATAVIIFGLAFKIRQYWVTPAPLKIPTTPAPTTRTGVIFRMAKEVVVFESLFKSNKWIWIFGWMFHMSLALVLARHIRYFQEQPWFWVNIIQPFGKYAAFTMVIGLLGLLARRFVVARVRYISAPSDYLMLIMLIFIGISGLMMQLIVRPDIIAIKEYFLSWMGFSITDLPISTPLVIHLLLVALLMIIFPFSKLLHAPGIFFSPTRNQVDNPREKRHISKWAAELETDNNKG
ncbi:MAG: nitrate reductase [Gammaproteobacteria bacterium]|jgi:nitrate reductase gamma subunit|nr:nitrate reductase [Gammaproteobacteria bacterium]MBT3725123.1 nitrate reductase [Gammaproteobacteria bacterium]MBT4077747.1 nitrate reductase [Gammaproteobacteria bacterium]MBT4193273.1 nitrate reductase [Gammaproteobacteria bacterium]MBT4451290.1 nitrate reductase [Gammaproteobacteria bacterium]